MAFDFFIQKAIKKAYIAHQSSPKFQPFAEIKRVLILFSVEDWESVRYIIDDLKSNGKQVIAWTMQTLTKEERLNPRIKFTDDVRAIDKSVDVSWMQTLSPKVIEEYEKLEYDTLIDLTSRSSNQLTYLLMKNRSMLCIGISENDYKIYNFIILRDESKGLLDTYQQIKYYLTSIR